MYFLSSDGSIRSHSEEQCFGWWLRDFDLTEASETMKKSKKVCVYCVSRVKDVQLHRAVSVDRPNVSQEVAPKCRNCSNFDLFEPKVDNLVELINKNDSKQLLLVAMLKPTLWNMKYQQKYNAMNHVPSMKQDKFKAGSMANLHKIVHNVSHTKIRFYPDDPAPLLLSKLTQIKELLNNIKEEIIESRITLKRLREDFEQDELCISHITKKTICLTQGIYDSKYLDNLILLLNEDFSNSSLRNWPFRSETSIIYSGKERNYIV